MMGAVLQTVNVRLPQPQIAYTLQHANAEILLVHRDFFPIVDALLPSLPAIKAVIAIMDGARGPIPDWAQGEYETLSAGASANYPRSEEHTSELQSLMRTSYAVFCLKKKIKYNTILQ